MKAKELALELLKNPDFDIHFKALKKDSWDVVDFKNIEVLDVGHPEKVILLTGIYYETN